MTQVKPDAPKPSVRGANFPQRADAHERLSGENYSLARIGKSEDLTRYAIRHPLVGATLPGKVFLKEMLGLSSMEISFGLIPANTSFPFYHKHQQNEEVYLFLKAQGKFQVDGENMEITDGTAIRVAPGGVRCFRNDSSEPMFYIVIQAKEGSLEQWTGTDGVGVPGDVVWPAAS
jgi:mannose-6-phosphate isomerase-like protein (cupin superfamily)